MSTIVLRRFTNPDTLKHIGNRYLIDLLSPHRAFFAHRGLELPEVASDGAVDCEKLAAIFMAPDTDMSADLAEALFFIHEMSVKETMDKLTDAAEERDINLDLPTDAEPADVAVRLWLRDPTLLQEIHAEHHLTRPKSFLYFQTDADPLPEFTPPARETLTAMEERLDNWFERKKRGRGCRVFVYPRDGECWFMVRHGEPCRREGSLDQGEPGSVFYRPQQHDILVYDAAQGEIRIHAGSKGERELYRTCFGFHLFGSEDFFPQEGKYTLNPLIEKGNEALSTEGVEDAIEWVRLKELETIWGGTGKGNREIEIRKATDLFAVFEKRGFRLEEFHNLRRAVFHVKFLDSKTPRSVTVEPTNKAKYERDYDSAAIEKWLTLRGFITEEPEDDEDDGNMDLS